MSNAELTEAFFTDAQLAPRAAGAPNPTGPRLRHFCGGNEPVVEYQPPGPLCWVELAQTPAD